MNKQVEDIITEFDEQYHGLDSLTQENVEQIIRDTHKRAVEDVIAYLEENVWEYTGVDYTTLNEAVKKAMGYD